MVVHFLNSDVGKLQRGESFKGEKASKGTGIAPGEAWERGR
jgi:hypothetical protein